MPPMEDEQPDKKSTQKKTVNQKNLQFRIDPKNQTHVHSTHSQTNEEREGEEQGDGEFVAER